MNLSNLSLQDAYETLNAVTPDAALSRHFSTLNKVDPDEFLRFANDGHLVLNRYDSQHRLRTYLLIEVEEPDEREYLLNSLKHDIPSMIGVEISEEMMGDILKAKAFTDTVSAREIVLNLDNEIICERFAGPNQDGEEYADGSLDNINGGYGVVMVNGFNNHIRFAFNINGFSSDKDLSSDLITSSAEINPNLIDPPGIDDLHKIIAWGSYEILQRFTEKTGMLENYLSKEPELIAVATLVAIQKSGSPHIEGYPKELLDHPEIRDVLPDVLEAVGGLMPEGLIAQLNRYEIAAASEASNGRRKLGMV